MSEGEDLLLYGILPISCFHCEPCPPQWRSLQSEIVDVGLPTSIMSFSVMQFGSSPRPNDGSRQYRLSDPCRVE